MQQPCLFYHTRQDGNRVRFLVSCNTFRISSLWLAEKTNEFNKTTVYRILLKIRQTRRGRSQNKTDVLCSQWILRPLLMIIAVLQPLHQLERSVHITRSYGYDEPGRNKTRAMKRQYNRANYVWCIKGLARARISSKMSTKRIQNVEGKVI